MKAICGANCDECELLNNKCKGCINTNGCPFGKKCWIAKYISVGGKENFIEGMSKIDDLSPLTGSYVNLAYTLPYGKKEKLLNDDEQYLGNQVECIFSDEEIKKLFGLVANMNFILVCEYEKNGENPELLLYKKR